MTHSGRPPKDPAEKQDERIAVQVTAKEKDLIDRAAKVAGASGSGGWLRQLGLREARKLGVR